MALKRASCTGACRPGHTWALPGLFRVLISQGPDAKTRGMLPDPYTYIAYTCLRTHGRTYSINTLQLRIKSGVAKSCPGTHTALQAPMAGWKLVYFFFRSSTNFSLPVNFMRQGISRPPCSSGERRLLPMTSTLMVPPLFRKYHGNFVGIPIFCFSCKL